MIKKIHACNRINFSSNAIEVIRPILNFFFFTKRFYAHQNHKKALKSTKSTKNTKSTKSTKTQLSKRTKRK